MDNMQCPLCCGKTFNSKHALVDHLSKHTVDYACPICQDSFSTISNLMDHLNLTTCRPADNTTTSADDTLNELAPTELKTYGVTFVMPKLEDSEGNSVMKNCNDHDYEDENGAPISAKDPELTELHEANLEATDMYEELLNKDGLQEAELSLLDGNGRSEYTIVTHDGMPAIMHNGALITKQNSDGTISITSVKDDDDEKPKLEQEMEPVITVLDKEPESNEQDIYSCNTCGVSFSSVLEHIQNFHKDQDVVVEVNEQSQSGLGELSQEEDGEPSTDQTLDTVTLNESNVENGEAQTMRRVITDTGDIVETATISEEVQGDADKSNPMSLIEEVLDKKGRVFTRRYVQVDKLEQQDPDAVLNNGVSQPKVPYHQVVVKEIVTMDGGAKMNVYNCVACHIYVTNIDEFKSHPCKPQKFACSQCPVSYDNSKSLLGHMKVHKLRIQPLTVSPSTVPTKDIVKVKYKCSHCSLSYDTARSFQAHMKVHKASKQSHSAKSAVTTDDIVQEFPAEMANGPFKCDICSTILPTNKSLKLHRRMHDPIKARPIEPPVEEHSDTNEDEPEKYFCAQCNKLIPVGYRIVHSNFHKSTDNFNCDICNKKFTSNSYLEMHMNVHNNDKVKVQKPDKTLPYTCLYCSRQFARPHEKVKHERIHTGEKPHSCEVCGKSFRVSYCLTLHMRTHTGARPYACFHCGKRFKAHSVFNHHLLTHSDVRAYKCPYCPKAFKTSVQLAGHKNSHTKPFSCTICNRPFASLYAVRIHTETHRRQNNLKFSCKMCGASYARSFALKDHMKQVHQQDMEPQESIGPSVMTLTDKGWVMDTDKIEIEETKVEIQEMHSVTMISNETETVVA